MVVFKPYIVKEWPRMAKAIPWMTGTIPGHPLNKTLVLVAICSCSCKHACIGQSTPYPMSSWHLLACTYLPGSRWEGRVRNITLELDCPWISLWFTGQPLDVSAPTLVSPLDNASHNIIWLCESDHITDQSDGSLLSATDELISHLLLG